MRRLAVVSAVLILSVGAVCQAQEKTAPAPLSLQQFIEKVMNHGSFREILMDELTLQYDRMLSSSQMQVLLQAGAGYSFDLEDAAGGSADGTVSVTGVFPLTGTTLTGTYDTGPASPLAGGGQTSGLLFKVEQSVLKNAFGHAERLRDLLAGKEMTVARYQVLEAYEDYLAEIISAYVRWYAAYENMNNAGQSLRDAATLLELTRQKQRYGVARTADVDKSTLQLLSREDQLLSARLAYEKLSRRVAALCGIPADDFSLIPSPVRTAVDRYVAGAQDETAFPDSSRTAGMLTLLTEISRQEWELSLDDLLPTAKIYGTYSLDGEGLFPSGTLSSEVELGFSLSLPLYSPEASARAEKNKIESDKTALHERNRREELDILAADLAATIKAQKKQLELAERKLVTARRILKDEQERYAQGKIGLDSLINARTTQEDAVQARLALLISLNTNYIEYLRFTDRLVDEEHRIAEDTLLEKRPGQDE
jgi:outer membrane protein TolC